MGNVRCKVIMMLALVALSLAAGCGKRPVIAVAIGWDKTASAHESEAAHAEQVDRLLTPRILGGPLAIAHVCNRKAGHLFYGAERPIMADAQSAFKLARQTCPCSEDADCGSDVATTLRILVDFLGKQKADRKVIIMHSDLVADACRTARLGFDAPESVAIPSDIELHAYGLTFPRKQALKSWGKEGVTCLHVSAEAIEANHLGLAPTSLL